MGDDTPITDVNNRINSFDPDAINPVSGTPGVVRFAGIDGWPTQPYGTDWNNFGPPGSGPYPQFNNVMIAFPTLGSHSYHAGIVKIEKRFSHGVSFLSTYTWARNIGNIDQAAGFGDDQIYQDYYNRQLDRGPLSTDVIHRFVWSSAYDLPFGRGRKWATSGFASHLIGGWQIRAIGTVQSGGPSTVTTQTNTTNSFSAGALRADVLRDPRLNERTISRWFDTTAFEPPPAYTFGNAGRGILRGDNRVNLDLSILVMAGCQTRP